MENLVVSCPTIDLEGVQYIRSDQFRGYVSNFRKALQYNDSSMLFQKRGLKITKIPDMEEFLESKEYLDLRGAVRPRIKYELQQLFEGGRYCVEVLAGGGIGVGKGFFAQCGTLYSVMLNGCLHNPQAEYDLAPGSSIYFVIQSKTETLARKAVFNELVEKVKRSPWFAKNFPFDKDIKTELRFPNNIYITPFGGQDTAALGLNVVGGILDELNFMERVQDSVHTRHTGEDEYDQAERIYNTISRRMKSRFQTYGRLPGKLFLISSSAYPGDFTDRKIEESKTDNTIYVMKLAQWESIPAEKYTGKKFLVEVGNEFRSSKIIRNRADAQDDGNIIEVPVEYRSDFDRDIEGALRDLAGISTSTKHPFIPYRERMVEIIKKTKAMTDNRSLFLTEEVTLSRDDWDYDEPDFSEIINLEYIENCILDPSQVFAFHIDVGTGGQGNDAAGLAVGHINGYKLLANSKYYNDTLGQFVEVQDIRAPIYQIDGALRINATGGDEVDLETVRDMMLWLRGYLNLKWGTADSYQSVMLLQAFKRARIRAGTLSVDTNLAPYAEVKTSIKEDRILFMGDILFQELRELERDGDKVDHPPQGCFASDTRVALLDGTNPTFEELGSMYREGEIFAVYGIGQNGIIPAFAYSPRITHKSAEVVEIILDNYQPIICTPDHLFLTTGFDWISAKDLTPDVSLMPLYRSTRRKGGWRDYEIYYDPILMTSQNLTHQMVAKYSFGDIPPDHIVHHIDGDKSNNDPSNLQIVDRREHLRKHTKTRHQSDLDYVKALREGHRQYRESRGNEKSRTNIQRLFDQGKLRKGKNLCAIIGCESVADAKGLCGAHYQQMRRMDLQHKKRTRGHGNNHGILSIRFLKEKRDVWDLSIVGTPIFALNSGVFVHNSKDVADSVAGVVFMLQHKEANYGRSRGSSRRLSRQSSGRVTQKMDAGETRIPARKKRTGRATGSRVVKMSRRRR